MRQTREIEAESGLIDAFDPFSASPRMFESPLTFTWNGCSTDQNAAMSTTERLAIDAAMVLIDRLL